MNREIFKKEIIDNRRRTFSLGENKDTFIYKSLINDKIYLILDDKFTLEITDTTIEFTYGTAKELKEFLLSLCVGENDENQT